MSLLAAQQRPPLVAWPFDRVMLIVWRLRRIISLTSGPNAAVGRLAKITRSVAPRACHASRLVPQARRCPNREPYYDPLRHCQR